MAEPLVIAVPKGRILAEVQPLLAAAGVVPEAAFFDEDSRALRFATQDPAIALIRVRAFDVATFVAHGAAQLGIAPGTFKSRIARGRTRLRALIEERSTPLLTDRTGRDTPPPAANRPTHLREKRDWRGVKIG